MSVHLNAYLNFRGRAREAMEFYRSVLGGELQLSTFKEFQASQDPAEDDLVMHSQLEKDGRILLMGADVPARMEHREPAGFSMSLSGDDEPTLRGYYEKLSEGGTIQEPLAQAPWGDTFGMFVDRFGVSWLVNIAGRRG